VKAALSIEGPGKIFAGEAAAEYTAKKGTALQAVQWVVEASSPVQFQTTNDGKTCKLSASAVGSLKLRALLVGEKDGQPTVETAEKEITVEAKPAPAPAVQIPVYGRHYGTLIIVVALLGAVTIILITSGFRTEIVTAVMGLLGSLLGYIFGERKGSGADTQATPKTAAPPAGEEQA